MITKFDIGQTVFLRNGIRDAVKEVRISEKGVQYYLVGGNGLYDEESLLGSEEESIRFRLEEAKAEVARLESLLEKPKDAEQSGTPRPKPSVFTSIFQNWL